MTKFGPPGGASRRRPTSPPKLAENRGFSKAAIFGAAGDRQNTKANIC